MTEANEPENIRISDEEFIRQFRAMTPEMQQLFADVLMLDHSDGHGRTYTPKEQLDAMRAHTARLIDRARSNAPGDQG